MGNFDPILLRDGSPVANVAALRDAAKRVAGETGR